jgi:hypothetical protein
MHNSQIIPQRISTAIFIIALFALAPSRQADAQGVAVAPRIIGVDSGAFPEIRLRALFLDQRGGAVAGVSPESIAVSENSHPVDFQVREEEGGMEIAFILDGGMGLYANGATGETRLEEMKAAVREVVTGSPWLAGKDRIDVIIQEPDGMLTLANGETPVSSIPARMAGYLPDAPDRLARPLDAVAAALDRFAAEQAGAAGRPQAIVLLSGILQTGPSVTASSVAAKARALGIPIHTILVRDGFELGENLQSLSASTGGLFKYYGPGGSASIAELKAVLNSMRRQVVITYRSEAGQSGTQTVSVELPSATASKPAIAQFEIAIQPPKAAIVSPANGQSVRPESAPVAQLGLKVDSALQWPADGKPGIPVAVSASWPDGHPRNIRQAVLLVNGKERQTLGSPASEIVLWWSPTAEEMALGSSAQLKIRLEDELGLTAESEPVVVRVAMGLFAGLCPSSGSGGLCELQMSSLVSFLALAVALAALGLMAANRKRLGEKAQTAAQSVSAFVQEVGETMRFHSRAGNANASLVDMDLRCGWGQAAYDVRGTITIGRSGEGASLQIHSGREDSPISRVHCTILEEDGVYYVRDEHSANGTSCNGIRLVPLERQSLQDGDILLLANPDRGGVRLLFQSAHGKTAAPSLDSESTCRMDRM